MKVKNPERNHRNIVGFDRDISTLGGMYKQSGITGFEIVINSTNRNQGQGLLQINKRC